jgi:Uma2 family endonuclease
VSQPTAQVEPKTITGDELFAMGDIGPCELVDGRIVPMAPTGGEHGRVEVRLGSRLEIFVRQKGIGWVVGGEVGIYTHRNPDTVRAADIAFISKERAPDGPPKGFMDVSPDLIVEIISPNDRWQDMRRKLSEYFSIGVQQVWIVEPETHSALVYRSVADITTLTESDTLIGDGPLAGFKLPVADIFAK